MLHEHQPVSHFPQFDRLEQVLEAWPTLFTTLPIATQPLHVEQGTVFVLSHSPEWSRFIEDHHDELVARMRPRIDPGVDLTIERLEVVPTTPTAIYLARQIIVILSRLRDLEVKF
jgi:hypothetical protein